MKYEITEEQMKELAKIVSNLNNLGTVFLGKDGLGFLRQTTTRLYGLMQRIEMQDVEDAT